MTKISVIVPMYKVEKHIKKCIENLKNQSLKDIEIIIVDDGSPDNCGKIADDYAETDKRIRVIHKENGGVSSARNAGIKVARGEYIGFVDPDDWIEPVMFEEMYKTAKDNNSDLCRCKGYYQINGNFKIAEDIIDNFHDRDVFESQYISRLFSTKSFSIQDRIPSAVWLCIFSRKLILEHNLLFSHDLTIGEDTLFNMEATFHCNKLSICEGKFYHYLINDVSATKAYSNNLFDNLYASWLSYKNFFEKNYYNQDIDDRLKMCIINFAIQSIINETRAKNTVFKSLSEILNICNNKELNLALSDVNVKTIPLKDRLKVFMMKYKFIPFIYFYYTVLRKK
ncbi:glycosyltransferase [Neobacillus sp. 19]|uniref:glycosyltransferase n=1 Tax=Neobacillus sp. 19 TaxID=3394458 RepID=UPI003BF68449